VPLPAGLCARGISAPGSVDEPVDGILSLPAYGGFVGAVT
jgi:hypothetical protein